MKKRILAALVVSALLLATGCAKKEADVSSSEATSESTASAAATTTDAESAADNTAESAATAESAEPASEPAQTAESTPAEQPTEESAQTEDNPLLAMDAQELYEMAHELSGDDTPYIEYARIKKYHNILEDSNRKLSCVYESFPQEDGSVAVVRSTVFIGLLECAESYYVSNTADGITAKLGERCDISDVSGMPEGYTMPAADYTDPMSPIDPDGLTAGDIYTAIDFLADVFSKAEIGECENRFNGGICTYNGDSSYEWVLSLFKKYFTEDLFNACYDAESGTLLGKYVNDNGTCVRNPVAFGGPIPEVFKCEFVTNNDSEIVVRTYLRDTAYGPYGDEWTVISALTKTENGWKISRCNEKE